LEKEKLSPEPRKNGAGKPTIRKVLKPERKSRGGSLTLRTNSSTCTKNAKAHRKKGCRKQGSKGETQLHLTCLGYADGGRQALLMGIDDSAEKSQGAKFQRGSNRKEAGFAHHRRAEG